MKRALLKVKPPKDVADFGRWLNEWGNLDQHEEHRGSAWRDGYKEAIGDAYKHFTNLVPDWHERAERR